MLLHPSHSTFADCNFLAYEGNDFPESWPLPSTPPVALVVENPVHYSVTGLDAQEEWAASNPKGFGYIRLGSEYRAFAVSMFHQLHCLRLFRSALAGDHREPTEMHFGHCLVYLRQLILCDADLTLEPYDILHRDYNVKQDHSIHVCRDWEQVYDAMAGNWENWLQYRNRAFSSPLNGTAP
ncbi:hypothetical protein FKP32DRAFT_1568900 [Trametes sanguinea]|nr:hypothetical protein FKP32DRAFT_1568900 [Trametes sanguinea]